MESKFIENQFTYHSPKEDQPARYEELRDTAKVLAHKMNDLCPESREKSLAMTKLKECIMWANASIAVNEVGMVDINQRAEGGGKQVKTGPNAALIPNDKKTREECSKNSIPTY